MSVVTVVFVVLAVLAILAGFGTIIRIVPNDGDRVITGFRCTVLFPFGQLLPLGS